MRLTWYSFFFCCISASKISLNLSIPSENTNQQFIHVLCLQVSCIKRNAVYGFVILFAMQKRNAKKAESEKKYYAQKKYVSGD